MRKGRQRRGRVTAIFLAEKAGAPMKSFTVAAAIAGSGLVTNSYIDRYGAGLGAWSIVRKGQVSREATVFSVTEVRQANRKLKRRNKFLFRQLRRNIAIRGIGRLSSLKSGTKLRFGREVVMEVDEYCSPCDRPDILAHKHGFKKAFKKKAGLRMKIKTGGILRRGDPVVVLD